MDHVNQDPQKGTSSRRQFLAAMSAAGLGAAALPLLTPRRASGADESPDVLNNTTTFPGIPGNNIDIKVLNFALTLEILEADLYRQAVNQASGLALSTALASNPSAYTRQVAPGGKFTSEKANVGYLYLVQFAYVEAAHRDFLTTAITSLGATPVTANPNGYAVPGGIGTTIEAILSSIYPLEETGVRAYLGAAPSLTTVTLIQTAGSIFTTEARHSAAIALLLGKEALPTPLDGGDSVSPDNPGAFEYYLNPTTVLNKAMAYYL